uniref:Uncharacterized LOC115588968 n=1 Tax=Sparus aurata TaxID=8175 RepID=A0A671XX79_SPAAU
MNRIRNLRHTPPLCVKSTLTGAQFSCGHCRVTATRAMKNFTLIAALSLCSISEYWEFITVNLFKHLSKGKCSCSFFVFLLSAFVSGWISASVSQYQTVEAQPGEEVTLQCNNISKYDSMTFWSRLVNRTKINCVVVMFSYRSRFKVCDGYEKGKFEMKSNISTVFLNIKKVDSSDSGLYYCGFVIDGIPSLTPIHLKVNGKSKGMAMLISVIILGALAGVFLLVIIVLVVKARKL